MVTFSTKCSRLISGMTSIFITPGFSGKKPVIELPGVETFQRSFPQDPGKFCTPFCTIRITLAAIWLTTGIISLGIYPVQDSLGLLAKIGISGDFALFTLFAEALMDIVIGVLTLTMPSKKLWLFQAAIVGGYSVVIAVCLPEFLIHPFGPILKNLPIFTLLWLLYRN
ncbi:MAG: hypothetical protein FJ190_12290 [Gammaproteobacteria bacterium]|nr:hypothetical protein [Gammaproteobacteria bacterium]